MNTTELMLGVGESPFFVKEKQFRYFVMYADLSWHEVPDNMNNFQSPFVEWKGETGTMNECKNVAAEFCRSNNLESPTLYIAWGKEHNKDRCGVYIRSTL